MTNLCACGQPIPDMGALAIAVAKVTFTSSPDGREITTVTLTDGTTVMFHSHQMPKVIAHLRALADDLEYEWNGLLSRMFNRELKRQPTRNQGAS